MQASNFGGIWPTFPLNFSMKFSQKTSLYFFFTMVQKSQKWPKTQIKGGGGGSLNRHVCVWVFVCRCVCALMYTYASLSRLVHVFGGPFISNNLKIRQKTATRCPTPHSELAARNSKRKWFHWFFDLQICQLRRIAIRSLESRPRVTVSRKWPGDRKKNFRLRAERVSSRGDSDRLNHSHVVCAGPCLSPPPLPMARWTANYMPLTDHRGGFGREVSTCVDHELSPAGRTNHHWLSTAEPVFLGQDYHRSLSRRNDTKRWTQQINQSKAQRWWRCWTYRWKTRRERCLCKAVWPIFSTVSDGRTSLLKKKKSKQCGQWHFHLIPVCWARYIMRSVIFLNKCLSLHPVFSSSFLAVVLPSTHEDFAYEARGTKSQTAQWSSRKMKLKAQHRLCKDLC